MDLQYAQVIVDLSAEAVDRLFTYSVPDGMILLPGQQVEVPFGPRRLEGFVVSVSDETDLDPARVRPVIRAVRDYPIILPELMQLADWMHKRYLCNLVDALRLMIPAEMRGGRVRESGTHEELLALGGYYHDLYTHQYREEAVQQTLKNA